MSAPGYTYHVNLNERGFYYADVRDPQGNTVFKVRAGAELADDETSVFEDGFMSDDRDMTGLAKYLADLGAIPPGTDIEYAG